MLITLKNLILGSLEMISLSKSRIIGSTYVVFLLVASSIGLLISPGPSVSFASGGSNTLPSTTFVAAPPAGSKGPDDITILSVPGVDGGRAVIWTAYQNGIQANGSAGTPGGQTQSTIAGYDKSSGSLVRVIYLIGKVDGLTADPKSGMLFATVNEDSRSAFNVINPAIGNVSTYSYSPDPAVAGNGGTDSIAVRGDKIYVAHSNPNDTSQATDYIVTLDKLTNTAKLTPLFYDNSTAIDAAKGSNIQLGLTDPDTNLIMPNAGERFADYLATIGQADGQIVFVKPSDRHQIYALNVTDNKPGNVPPLDGMAVATSGNGTLYVVDTKAGTIQALNTTGWSKGTVFVGEPSDNSNPHVGVLNMTTGKITALGNSFQSPKGLLFVPS